MTTSSIQPVTSTQLKEIMQHAAESDLTTYINPLNAAMAEYEINTPNRQRAFIAQLAHESGELRYKQELGDASYFEKMYQGRADLGNIHPGDGARYCGRGLIQITGRSNYREVGKALGVDLEGYPEKLLDPIVSCRSAGYFWKSRGLNPFADVGNFKEITRRINGGYNGLADRLAYYERAKVAII